MGTLLYKNKKNLYFYSSSKWICRENDIKQLSLFVLIGHKITLIDNLKFLKNNVLSHVPIFLSFYPIFDKSILQLLTVFRPFLGKSN